MPLKYIKIFLSKDYMTKIKEKEKILILIIQIWNLYLDILNNKIVQSYIELLTKMMKMNLFHVKMKIEFIKDIIVVVQKYMK